jgi:hypothetical protein
MENRQVRELLGAHADQLVDPQAGPSAELTPNERVQGLLDLAEQLHGLLIPVVPDAHFRRRLHGELVLEAQRRQSEPEEGLFQQHRTGILIGAAAVGSVASVVGVAIAFVLRHRHRTATRIATG